MLIDYLLKIDDLAGAHQYAPLLLVKRIFIAVWSRDRTTLFCPYRYLGYNPAVMVMISVILNCTVKGESAARP